MVSPLWTAAAENDVENLTKLLPDASQADIEITDGSGATPLIQAVKAGHVDIVRVLLDRGADPNHASNEGRPEQLASNPVILQLIQAAQAKLAQANGAHPMSSPPPEGAYDPNMQYWAPPPPGMYGYYPGPGPMAPAGSPEGVPPPQMGYYPVPIPMGPGNLPPPDIARMIPCRFFPACRYGSACMFAHPPTQNPPNGGFYPTALPPPGPYGPYDPAQHPGAYGPGFYPPVSPATYHPSGAPNGIPPPMAPPQHDPSSPVNGGPTPPVMHNGPTSPVQGGFSPMPVSPPQGGAYPVPMSSGYPQGVIPPPGAPMYSPVPPPIFTPPQQGVEHGMPASGPPPNGPGHHRRGSTRRPSLAGARKPACIFFPSGRCKNGDDCRFPHVLPDGPNGQPSVRGPPRPRYSAAHTNGFATLDEKMAQLSLQDGQARGPANGPRGFGGARAEHQRLRGPNGPPPPSKQRLPGADEFPTLNGTSTPASRASPPASTAGLTAAQVLQAPAPARKDFRDAVASKPTSVNGSATSANGSVDGDVSDHETKAEVASVTSNGTPIPKVAVKLPLSFAAAANSAVASTPELSVSA